jgi:hypothetical protein
LSAAVCESENGLSTALKLSAEGIADWIYIRNSCMLNIQATFITFSWFVYWWKLVRKMKPCALLFCLMFCDSGSQPYQIGIFSPIFLLYYHIMHAPVLFISHAKDIF